MAYAPIEDYGLIGDMHAIALVGPDASIDYLCLPHMDSPTVFAALLDDEAGGRFRIAPCTGGARIRQFYVPDTNILLTRFLSDEGVAEVMDFMPVPEPAHAHRIVRIVTSVKGRTPLRLVCDPRFDYARAGRRTDVVNGRASFVSDAPDGVHLRLSGEVPLTRTDDGAAMAEFAIDPGCRRAFVLEAVREGDNQPLDPRAFACAAFQSTLGYWRSWISRGARRSRWNAEVNRSALAMKLLTSRPTGAIAAAATFGLPEGIGGERNWDYRYAWIRDASLTAATLIDMGYHDEPRAYAGWLAERLRASGDGKLQIMFGLDGRADLHEEILGHLEGYRGSAPVRIGNGAYDQLQLDIYGEMLLFLDRFDAAVEALPRRLWSDVVRSVDWVADNWDREDEGVWEVRGGRRKFLYSRLMDWVALDRALKIAARGSRPAPVVRWREVRDAIHAEIMANFFDPSEGIFVQSRNSTVLDASCLLMPLVGFIGPRDPDWLSTLDAIGRDLVDDSLVYRYRTGEAASDGLKGTEGTFSMCTFWYVDCLARAGRVEEARLIFEKMLHYAGPLGLYAEELGAKGEHLGNYPQAFTHLGLVGAARALDAALDAAQERRAVDA